MKKFTAVIMALLVVMPLTGTSAVEAAEEKCLRWQHPGANPNQLPLDESLRLIASGEEAAKAYAAMRPGVFTLADIRDSLKTTDIPEEKRRESARIIERYRKAKPFLALTALEKMPLPSEVLQTLRVRETRPVPYRSVTLRKGDKIPGPMTYERGIVVPCVIFDPAPNEPQTLDVHVYDVDLGDEIVEFYHSPICSNVAKGKRAKKPKPAPAVAAPTPAKKRAEAPLADGPTFKTLTAVIWTEGPESSVTSRFQEANQFQSRDLGEQAAAARSTNTALISGCAGDSAARFEFINVNSARARGKPIQRGGSPELIPAGFDSANPTLRSFRVPICNGMAVLGIEWATWREWIPENGVVAVHLEGEVLKRVKYPGIGTLITCSGDGNDAGKCGKEWGAKPGEIHANLSRVANVRFNFTVRSPLPTGAAR